MIYPDIVSALLRAVLDGPLPPKEATVRDEPAGDRGGREEKAFAAIIAEKGHGRNAIIPPCE
jgi:hypothetical protein